MSGPHHLEDLPGFPSEIARMLKRNFAITSAEQFIDLDNRMSHKLLDLFNNDKIMLRQCRDAARSALADEDVQSLIDPPEADYPFMTGFEPPDGS